MGSRLAAFLAGALALAAFSGGAASAVDLHAFWDSRCGGCHGHSAEFGHRFLSVEKGRLLGRHHRDDLVRFLGSHYLPSELVDPVMQMLAAQLTSHPRFKTECGNCHDNAAALAREALVIRDGVLIGRKSGRIIGDFLKEHAGAGAAPDVFLHALTRVTREVHGP